METENRNKLGSKLLIVLLMFFGTLVFGYLSFDCYNAEAPFLQKLYWSIQLFTTESGNGLPEKFDVNKIPWIFNVARYLAVFTLILTVAFTLGELVKRNFTLFRTRRMKGHIILCGMGELGFAFVDNLKGKYKLVVIEKNLENENIETLRARGISVISGNALDPLTLVNAGIKKAEKLFSLTGSDFDSMTIANQALKLTNGSIKIAVNIYSRNLKRAALLERCNIPGAVTCKLHTDVVRLSQLAEKMVSEEGNIQDIKLEYEQLKGKLLNPDAEKDPQTTDLFFPIHYFNTNEIVARYVFWKYPPDKMKWKGSPTTEKTKPVHILLLGFGRIGEEFYNLCLQNCHYLSEGNTRVTLVSIDAAKAETKTAVKHKNIEKLIDLKFHVLNPNHLTPCKIIEFGLTDADVVYVCNDLDPFQLTNSAVARELFGGEVPIIRWFSHHVPVMYDSVTDINTYTVPVMKEVATMENFHDEALDNKAKALHYRWLKKALGDYIKDVELSIKTKAALPAPKSTMVAWEWLTEEIRDDNRSAVEHQLAKLRAMGQNPEGADDSAPIDFGFLENPDKVNLLAEMEHRRWMAVKYFYGWEFSNERDDTRKLHTDLKPYHLLNEKTKDYDVKQVMEIEETFLLK